ncbi:MAG: hypothetical protein L3V56_07465 [Candidatus Magnetoovum sp. WYHC-5]|nr:hypothetical protein [Candidatus Magnetoovum sp. WYHC-5]
MKDNTQSCDTNKMKNSVKFSIMAVIFLVVFIYAVLLFTGRFGKEPVKLPTKSTNPVELNAAQKTIDELIGDANKKTTFVTSTVEQPLYFEIKVVGIDWKKQAIDDKKEFLQKVSEARTKLGLNPNIKIIDDKSGVEYASFENGRASLVELDL